MIPLAAEAGWAELIAGVVLLCAAAFLFDRFPVITISVLVAATAVPAVAISPLARARPVLAVAVFSYLAGRRVNEVNSLPAWTALAVLPVSVFVGGFVSGLYNWFVFVLVLLVAVMLPWLGGRYRRQRTWGAWPGGVPGGSGIAGLRDRVEALGGTVTAGPKDGGWELSATLPPAKREVVEAA